MMYRMTYERAGTIFRAMKYIPEAMGKESLYEIADMRLVPPDKNMRFDEWLDFNANKLQLFDEEICDIFSYWFGESGEGIIRKHVCYYDSDIPF